MVADFLFLVSEIALSSVKAAAVIYPHLIKEKKVY